MKKLWTMLGRIAFWASLPALHFYLKLSKRTRILVVCDDKALVLKGWLNDGSWSLPGGGLHRRESPVKGVCRELYEETGIKLEPKDIIELGFAHQKQHWLNFSYYQYFVELRDLKKIRPQRFEIVECQWLDIDQLTQHNAQAHVLQTLAAWRAHN